MVTKTTILRREYINTFFKATLCTELTEELEVSAYPVCEILKSKLPIYFLYYDYEYGIPLLFASRLYAKKKVSKHSQSLIHLPE